MPQEVHYKLLKILESDSTLSQRQLAKKLGISLGKANYCLKALIEKGWIKSRNFKNSKNKSGYAYILTPHGLEEKAKVAVYFLKRKQEEYEQLKKEIEQLQREVV